MGELIRAEGLALVLWSRKIGSKREDGTSFWSLSCTLLVQFVFGISRLLAFLERKSGQVCLIQFFETPRTWKEP